MRQILLITGGAILVFSLMMGGFALNQANQEEIELSSRLQSRTQILAESLSESIGPSYRSNATTTLNSIINRFVSNERLVGLAVFDSAGELVAQSENLPTETISRANIETVMDSADASGTFVRSSDMSLYTFTMPLFEEGRVIGALTVVQNATYIDDGVRQVWLSNVLRLVLQVFLFAVTIFLFLRFVIFRPLSRITEAIRSSRAGKEPGPDFPMDGFWWRPLSSEISKMTSSLKQARSSASEEARMRLEKLDSPWTEERLKEFMKAYLKDRPLFVVSNREPYVHTKTKNGIAVSVPAGGAVTALESLLQACGGMWIAHGSGSADRDVVDENDTIAVPPEEPKYTLKRVWLEPEEIAGYYNGFSNEALWPLCHMAHVRPMFRAENWRDYEKVNEHFANVLLAEIQDVERPIILVQDYHLALVPALVKKSRPDVQIAIFWHIPWPNAAQFSICPWRKEIIRGMLGADLVGFHTQQYCNNFMETVGNEIESRIDYEHFSITHDDHETHVKPFPISIAFTGGATPQVHERSALDGLGITAEYVGLGVERLDYTKGILERFKGLEFFFEEHPEFRKRFTFLQIASPSRESIEKYREYAEEVKAEAERINAAIGTRDWQPIVLENRNYSHAALRPLFALANVCLVTPVHDGMNLVSKEYVAAHDDEMGVLVLSHFAGASRDLKGALLVNPYSAESTAEAIFKALTMAPGEQRRRMKAMRESVRNYNVYRWSAELIKALAQL